MEVNKKRESGIELLRVILMIQIILSHMQMKQMQLLIGKRVQTDIGTTNSLLMREKKPKN